MEREGAGEKGVPKKTEEKVGGEGEEGGTGGGGVLEKLENQWPPFFSTASLTLSKAGGGGG